MKLKFDCKEYKTKELELIKKEILNSKIKPNITIIQVGNNESSNIYIRNKIKTCDYLGINANLIKLETNISEIYLIDLIESLNNNNKINGILVQLPLPKHINSSTIINTIDYKKDIDGLTNINLGKLINKEDSFLPCTAKGIIEILDNLKIDLDGKRITIIGRSTLVGIPLYLLLLQRNATPTICHTHTINLKEYTKNSDIIISAAGTKKNLITKDMVNKDSIIIDVSIFKDENNITIGDADYNNLVDYVKYITPVPGGVGQLTILELMKNILKTIKK